MPRFGAREKKTGDRSFEDYLALRLFGFGTELILF